MDCFIGLDLGTSKISAVALDLEGAILASASLAGDADVTGLPAGRHEQSPARLLELSLDLLGEMTDRLGPTARDVTGLGLTGQMHGALLADRDLGPLTNLITWQDRRAEEHPPGAERAVLDELRRRVDGHGCRDGGARIASGYMGATLFWFLLGPGLPDGARRALLLADWVAARLTGADPVTDPGNAASTGLYDVEGGRWDEALLGALGIGPELLPPVGESGALLGRVTEAVADRTGLPDGTPVHVALGDNQASVLASLREPSRELLVNVGTGGQVSAVTETALQGPDLEARPFPGRRLLAVGASLCGGSAFTYLAEHYARAVGAVTGAEPPLGEVLDVLTRLAGEVPAGADGLTAETLFRGRRSDPGRRGALTGMGPENNSPGHWARAFIEGLVDELAGLYVQMARSGLEARTRLVGAGNGMRLNPVVREAARSAFGMPLVTPAWRDEAACGAALAAMVGGGALDSFPAAASVVRHEAPDDPDASSEGGG